MSAGREELQGLARTVYADPARAMEAAAEIRDLQFGPRVTYSRKAPVVKRSCLLWIEEIGRTSRRTTLCGVPEREYSFG